MPKKKEEQLPPPTFPELFAHFSKFGDSKSDGKTITLSQSDKWMMQANMLGVTKISTTVTGLCFNKFKRRTISFQDYKKFLQDVAKVKGTLYEDIITNLMTCGMPGAPPSNAAPAMKPLS